MKDKSHTTRRQFMRNTVATSTAVSLPLIATSQALGQGAKTAPSGKITLGVIGCGPRCRYVLGGMLTLEDVQCVALADVQKSRRDEGKALIDELNGNSDCVLYKDFREILARDDIDAVLIATGDRWHAHAAMMAAEAGKDVYCEKPCAITIGLCQELAETFARTGRIFQAGTQRRSVANFRQAVEMAQSGALGKIHTLYASIYEPKFRTEWRPGEPTPHPDDVDWNMWLGPAPWRLYNSKYVSGGWRGFYDFDSGSRLLDWGAHTVDLCQWAANADDTMPVEYVPGEKEITAHYANGVKLVMEFLETPFAERPGWHQHLGTCPVRFVGDAGWVETGDSGGIEVGPESLKAKMKDLPQSVEASEVNAQPGLKVVAHARNFVDCIKSRQPTVTNPNVVLHSHITCHAAAMAWMLKRPLKFDPKAEAFIEDDEANRMRTRTVRDWSV
jgi:predicted dehydrogenase